LSLLGIPPLAGFFAKFQVFAAVFHAGQTEATAAHPWLGPVYYALLVIGGVNTAFSAFYYVRVLKVMVLDRSLDDVEGRESPPLRLPAAAAVYAGLMATAVFVLGVYVDPLAAASRDGVETFAKAVPVALPTNVEPPAMRPIRGRQPGPGPNRGNQPKANPKAGAGRDE
jgi:NADH-quinone oxidoreductase subunit N